MTVSATQASVNGAGVAVNFKLDSQYDNIKAVAGQTKFTPEAYIYRKNKHLETYKISYTVGDIPTATPGKLTIKSEQSNTNANDVNKYISKDAHGKDLVLNRRYLVLMVDYSDYAADGNTLADSSYNGYYICTNVNTGEFSLDNDRHARNAHFTEKHGMDTARSTPKSVTNAGPWRVAVIPSGESASYSARGLQANGSLANDTSQVTSSSFGGVLTSSTPLSTTDNMKQNSTVFFQKMTQLVRNEPHQYTKGATNSFPYYRIESVPSRLDHSDIVIIILRASAQTGASEGGHLVYDRLMDGDIIKAFQLRGAIDWNGKSSHSGDILSGTNTTMPDFFLNTQSEGSLYEVVPKGSLIQLSENSTSLDTADANIFTKKNLKVTQFLHSETSDTSLQYARISSARQPSGSDSTTNKVAYGTSEAIYQFRAANSLVFENTESMPLYD